MVTVMKELLNSFKNGKALPFMAVVGIGLLAGCSSPSQRMAECEAQGVSKDACYVAEQNKQAATNAAAQKQAMENAQALYPVQKAQSAKKAGVKHWQGRKLEMTQNGLTVDGLPAAVSETNKEATVYQQGLFSYVVYANGKIAVLDEKNQFKGYAK